MLSSTVVKRIVAIGGAAAVMIAQLFFKYRSLIVVEF